MEESISRNLKRLIRKYEFLLEDWEDVYEISKKANQEMMREINKQRPPEINDSDFTVKEEEEESSKEPAAEDKILKKLFRKIVVKCHPDKLPEDLSDIQKALMLNLYDQAIDAHDTNNWALMVVVAIKVGVELPEEANEMIDLISKNVAELEEKINSTINGPAWIFYHIENSKKEEYIKNYLNILLSIKSKTNEFAIEDQIKSKGTMKILGVGHPRTGTGYTSKILKSWGLDVGHETLREDGTVDWSLSIAKKSLWQNVYFKEWNWQKVIYCVRDPKESIPSIIFTEDTREDSVNFRASYLPYYNRSRKPIEKAIDSIVGWDQLIRSNFKDLIPYRIEYDSENLFNVLKKDFNIEWNDLEIGNKYNSRKHPGWEDIDISNLKPSYVRKINSFCRMYGYPDLF